MLAQQLWGLGAMTAAGLIGAFAYDIYRALRTLVGLKKKGTFLGDLFYSLLMMLFFILLLLRLNDGELRSYVYLGLLLGYVVYFGVLHRFLWKPVFVLCQVLCFAGGMLWRLISWPWRMLGRLITLPIRRVRQYGAQRREKRRQREAEALGNTEEARDAHEYCD